MIRVLMAKVTLYRQRRKLCHILHMPLSFYQAPLPFLVKQWSICSSQFSPLLLVVNIDNLTLDDEVQEADSSAIKLRSGLLSPPCFLNDTTCLRPIPPMFKANTSSFEKDSLKHANYKVHIAIHPFGTLLTVVCAPVRENLDLAPKGDFTVRTDIFKNQQEDRFDLMI